MAELAVGLTKSVVEGALTKAQSAIEEEGKLRRSAQRDLVFITGEFQMMQSFLTVANEERVGNLVVMTWVRQIRELAFDVEDCIEFVVHLDKNKSSTWRRVLRSFVPPCIHTAPLPLDEAVDEIEQLKARVEDVSLRNARYSLISDTGSKPVAQQPAAPSAAAAAAGATALHLLLEERDAAKRQQGDLTQFIPLKDDNLQVISVWGSNGDLGTTSLIRKAYSDQEICTTFTRRAWVKLTHPFDPHEFLRCLMTQFYEETCRGQGHAVGVHVLKKMKQTEEKMLEEFEQQVTMNRYLVVLEDVSSMVEWDAVRTFLPDMKNGSWIIVSTLQSEIARLCVGHPAQVLELKQFSAEHSVYAFFKEGTHSVRDKTDVTDMVSQSSDEISASSGLLISHNQGAGGSLPSSSNNRSIPASTKKSAIQWVEENPLVGRDAEMNELREIVAMTGYDHHRVSMSVWGIAGVGKSHLVRSLYYNTMIHGQRFDQYSWMKVSRPFNLRDFTRGLLLGFQLECPEAKGTAYRHMMGSKNPIQECRALLKNYHCLVVIDDLQTKEEWDLIRDNLVSPSDSLIIVITTEGSIATHCAYNKEHVFNVKGLQADAASDLFKKEMHRKKKQPSVEQDHNNVIIQELIPKCGGLPKVIVDVARLLAKKTVNRMDTAQSINERFIHQLETNPEFNSLRDLFDWMHTYFRTCPYFLKPCIFYMSIFPQDHSICRRRLVRRWIAEGYSRDGEENSAEDKGEEYFSKLLDLSIIQQPPPVVTTALAETRKVFWQVNGFIREYIVSRRMEENLVFELGDSSTLTTQRTGRHLAIRKSWDRDKIVFESIDFSRLRSLTVFGEWKSFLISEDMKLLRVLDLEDAFGITDNDVEQVVKLLRRLKFLSLRNCRDIHHLPSSLGDLRQLQTLDVRHTSIATLPVSVTKLQKLQYIRAGTNIVAEDQSSRCPSVSWPLSTTSRRRQVVGVKLPRGTGKLTALHTVGVINIGASGGKAILKELKELTQLRKLGVSGINKTNSSRFFSAISGHAHLESLLVHLDKGSEDCLNDIDISKDLKKIRSLKLYGFLDKLPRGFDQLSKLTKLSLEMDILNLGVTELIGKLPELSILRLNMKQVENKRLHFCVTVNSVETPSYENVRVLEITCNSVVHVTFGSLAMKNLELLKAPESSVTVHENLKKLRTQPALGPGL